MKSVVVYYRGSHHEVFSPDQFDYPYNKFLTKINNRFLTSEYKLI